MQQQCLAISVVLASGEFDINNIFLFKEKVGTLPNELYKKQICGIVSIYIADFSQNLGYKNLYRRFQPKLGI